jgi:hypothetical protein
MRACARRIVSGGGTTKATSLTGATPNALLGPDTPQPHPQPTPSL